MLHFEPSFDLKCAQHEESVRSRILGETMDGRLLFMLNTTTNTRIELVSQDGSSLTVFSFKKYMDIINAELSSDNELLHLTERVPDPNGFAFNSVVFHIHTPARSKDWFSTFPIDAYFLNDCQFPVYQMIHVVGNRMTHLRITINKKKIEIEKLRGGIHIPHLISSYFDKSTQKLAAVFRSEENNNNFYFADFSFDKEFSRPKMPSKMNVKQTSELPLELALNPMYRTHLPIFNLETNRFFFSHYHSKAAVIYQTYEGEQSSLSFELTVFPKASNYSFSIPGVRPDLPLCYSTFQSISLIYAPNSFLCMIDIAQNPPFISVLNKSFVKSPCSNCAAVCPLNNHIVDIETSTIYRVSIDLTNPNPYLQSMETNAWKVLAHFAARLETSPITASTLNLMEKMNDFIALGSFSAELFSCLGASECLQVYRPQTPQRSQSTRLLGSLIGSTTSSSLNSQYISMGKYRFSQEINEMIHEFEFEFPSAGKISRTSRFRTIVKDLLMKKESKSADDAANKAIIKLSKQNEAVLLLRDAIDLYINQFNESQPWKLYVGLVIQNECAIGNFPEIPCLKEEVSAEVEEVCPDTIEALVQKVGIFGPMTWETEEEYEYWSARVPKPDRSSDSMSSKSGASFVLSGRSRSHIEFSEDGSSYTISPNL